MMGLCNKIDRNNHFIFTTYESYCVTENINMVERLYMRNMVYLPPVIRSLGERGVVTIYRCSFVRYLHVGVEVVVTQSLFSFVLTKPFSSLRIVTCQSSEGKWYLFLRWSAQYVGVG